ncbi:MAG: hypothetical protein IJL55_09835 [Lachnospiraceae bacterium]|jgi:hypothetical protein|nr:hypothetical protein [Lachnospiraceae bacterium]
MMKKILVLIVLLGIILVVSGCNRNENGEVINNSDSENDDKISTDGTGQLENTNETEGIENVIEYIEWVDQSKLNIDINNYIILESNLQYVLASNNKIAEKTNDGVYEIDMTSKGTVLLFNGENVNEKDVLWIELSSAYPEWRETVKRTDIPDCVLTIKGGKVIRTSDPTDYLKKD